jgi:hypothetical protein
MSMDAEPLYYPCNGLSNQLIHHIASIAYLSLGGKTMQICDDRVKPEAHNVEVINAARMECYIIDMFWRFYVTFQPPEKMRRYIKLVQSHVQSQNGICLHHRNGWDWNSHCERWSSIPDGICHGNCLESSSFLRDLHYRDWTDFALKGSGPILDLKALIDFFVCRDIDTCWQFSIHIFCVTNCRKTWSIVFCIILKAYHEGISWIHFDR